MKTAQRSFSFGEVAPALYARTDLAFYGQALRTLRNAYVMRTGGIQSRPGTAYKGTTKSNGQARLVACVFADDQNYVLEFGNLYVRFWKNGTSIAATVSGEWADATAYAAGIVVSYSGTNYVCLQAHTSATATNRPSTGASWTAYWAALSGTIYELLTPYTTAQLAALQFAQTPGVLTIVHPSHPPAQLTRTADNQWDLADINFAVPGNIAAPTGVTGLIDTSGLSAWVTSTSYVLNSLVTKSTVVYRCILAHTSGASTEPGVGASWTTYWAVKGTGGDDLGYWYVVTAVNGSGQESIASSAIKTDVSQNALSPTWRNVTISWSSVTGAVEYRVYRSQASALGYRRLIVTSITLAVDSNPFSTAYISNLGPPSAEYVFSGSGEYPASVAFYQQRLLLAGSNNDPDTIYASVTGLPFDFNVRSPIQDDDAISWRQLSKQAVQVRHLLDISNRLLAFTNIGEYVIAGGGDGVLRPGEINPTVFSYNGANSLDPLPLDSTALYVQARGSKVLELNFAQGNPSGSDVSLMAAHLLDGYEISSWCYQEVPHRIVWLVRSDGKLLSLSYVPEAGIIGWAQNDTDGVFESVCSVLEGSEDAVYAIVRRTVNSSTVRYVERFANRIASGTKVLADASVSKTTLSTGVNQGLILSNVLYEISTNTTFATATSSNSGSAFAATDVGSAIDLYVSGSWGRWTISAYTDPSQVEISRSSAWSLPASVTRENWAYVPFSTSGLSHLEGKSVSISNNGVTVASPNNSAYTVVTVSSGALSSGSRYGYTGSSSTFVVGLPYTVDLETLDIDQGRGSIKNDNIRIGEVFVWIQDSGSFYIGPKSVTGSGLTGMELYTPSNDESYPLAAGQTFTGVAPVTLQSTYTKNGRIFIRQPDPVPLTVLAVIPEGVINGRN